jgi:GTP-binding protein HflX
VNRVHGDTASLKPSHARQLQKLGDRSVPPDQVVSPALARDVLDLAHEIGRRVGLFVDRRGRISRVILGDAHSLELPEFSRVRGVSGRLRGIRLVVTHLVPEPLDREELADLTKLRLDMVAAIHRGPAGITVDLASLGAAPPELSEAFRTRTWPRTPLSILARADEEAPQSETAGRRPQPDPRSFMGAGKLRQVLVRALEQDVELLICDPELSASQARTIADETELKVIDRTMLILDIFAKHARSSDGKLQVELAQLRYLLPKMMGKGTMMSRLMGGVGGRGPGETKLEIDRRRAKDRIADLEERLRQLRKQRDQQRAERKRSRVPVVAIVGYTNAGKSTLLNTVTGSDVDAEDKLFATLDPTVRRIRFPMDREIVLLDTVGFIRDLPPALRQAFSATLEEIAAADLLLHVVDATDPDREQQVATVDAVLAELGAGRVPRFVVLNKCDALPEPPADEELARLTGGDRVFMVSALEKRTTRGLMEAIESHLWERGRVERPDHAAWGGPRNASGDEPLASEAAAAVGAPATGGSPEEAGDEREEQPEAEAEHAEHREQHAATRSRPAAARAQPGGPLHEGDERDEDEQPGHGAES